MTIEHYCDNNGAYPENIESLKASISKENGVLMDRYLDLIDVRSTYTLTGDPCSFEMWTGFWIADRRFWDSDVQIWKTIL